MNEHEEIQTKEQLRSSRFPEAVAMLFVVIILSFLFVKILMF